MNDVDGIDYCEVCHYFAGAFGCVNGICRKPTASSMVAPAPTEALGPEWHRFPGELPPERKLVLVQIGIGRTDVGLPAAMVAGYLRFAAGEKDSPFFVTPGVDRRDERRVEFWCDCLPESFQPPAWRFPDRPPARVAAPPVGDLPAGEKTWTNHALDWIDANVPHGHYLVSEALAATKDLPSLVVPASVGDLQAFACAKCPRGFSAYADLEAHQRSCVGDLPQGAREAEAIRLLRLMQQAAVDKHCELRVVDEFLAAVDAATPAAQGALATPGEATREEAREVAHRIMTGLCRWPRGQHSAKCTEVRDAFIADRRAATPAAQRRPAREAKLMEMGQACLDWATDTGECHFCDFGGLKPGSRPHAEDCPVREHDELPAEADRRGEP